MFMSVQEVQQSAYIVQKRPAAKQILDALLAKYAYASVLVTDCIGKNYRVGRSGIAISQDNSFGGKGMVVKVYDGRGYAEYSSNEITESRVDEIVAEIERRLVPLTTSLPHGLEESTYRQLQDEPCTFRKASTYKLHPTAVGDRKIIETLTAIREKTLASRSELIDSVVGVSYQEYHKLFLSANRDMEQSVLWVCGSINAVACRGERVENAFKGFSNLGGMELLAQIEANSSAIADTAAALLDAEPIEPGTYTCICDPDVTGMIVHEAFGHGVEMDMFVKDRALAQTYVGKQVASPLITMHDGCAVPEVATYFFDDEGTLSHDTVIIDHGILQRGISDAQSAMHLGTEPTGNGRRESYERKAYTRMTNTYFEPGQDKLADMIASVDYGMYLEQPSSGMEDPKNWGIQCMVSIAREIRNGKLTGRIFSPIVLTGYVPDLLKSISMVSDTLALGGCGACGKGYKEWVKVSDGGPYIKAKIRLG